MKYTYEVLSSAINLILPDVTNTMLDSGTRELLYKAAIHAFLHQTDVDFLNSFKKQVAVTLVKDALQELHKEGCIVYGSDTYSFGE